jgi:hypothetical protein
MNVSFSQFAVAEHVPRVSSPKVLGYETQARVAGLEHGLGFVLFMEDGRLHLLEGFAWGPENTTALDRAALEFEVYKEAVQRIS